MAYIMFLMYQNSLSKDALQDKDKEDRLQKYEKLRYLSISNRHILDLETLIYRCTDHDNVSDSGGINNVRWMFSDDLTQCCTYSWYEKWGALRVIEKGVVNENALYKARFLNPDGSEVDLSRPLAFGLGYKGDKTIDAYIEHFKALHAFKPHDWDQSTIEQIKIARKNLDNFYKVNSP